MSSNCGKVNFSWVNGDNKDIFLSFACLVNLTLTKMSEAGYQISQLLIISMHVNILFWLSKKLNLHIAGNNACHVAAILQEYLKLDSIFSPIFVYICCCLCMVS